jgi:hypothetical protein
MNAQHCHCHSESRGRLSNWAGALANLASPVVRLHHLRNIRTHMLHEALEHLDSCSSNGKTCGDDR